MKAYQQDFINKAAEMFDSETITRSQALQVAQELGHGLPHWFLSKYKVDRNQYTINYNGAQVQTKWGDRYRKADNHQHTTTEQHAANQQQHVNAIESDKVITPSQLNKQVSFVPVKNPFYVKDGHFKDVVQIIKSNVFLPTFITGLSGMGKTQEVTEACAQLKRELIRVNITIETDEDDLVGHYVLINGETIWQDGPIVTAMERGAILLLDEVDLASNKIMCLQPMLEGGPIFIKKINRVVYPSKGFNVFATANTKGKGSDDGRFIGTNVLNEAFLDRFPLTFEQSYPSNKVEHKILTAIMDSYELEDKDYVQHLCDWADVIRRTFNDGGVDEVISTRRLINIIHTYAIFKNKQKAIEFAINRFDDDTKISFLDLYTKVDPTATPEASDETTSAEVENSTDKPEDIVFA